MSKKESVPQFAIMTKALVSAGQDANALAVLTALVMHFQDKPTCWPTIPTLAAIVKRHPNTVVSQLERLEKAGIIDIDRRNGANHTYRWGTVTPTVDCEGSETATPTADVTTPTVDSGATPTAGSGVKQHGKEHKNNNTADVANSQEDDGNEERDNHARVTSDLVARGITEDTAKKLATDHYRAAVAWLAEDPKKHPKVRTWAGWLVSMISIDELPPQSSDPYHAWRAQAQKGKRVVTDADLAGDPVPVLSKDERAAITARMLAGIEAGRQRRLAAESAGMVA